MLLTFKTTPQLNLVVEKDRGRRTLILLRCLHRMTCMSTSDQGPKSIREQVNKMLTAHNKPFFVVTVMDSMLLGKREGIRVIS